MFGGAGGQGGSDGDLFVVLEVEVSEGTFTFVKDQTIN